MNGTLKLSLSALLLFHGVGYAVNPVQGLYGNFSLGGSYAPAVNINVVRPTNHTTTTGHLVHSGYGNVFGSLGYRINQFRAEAELGYNKSPYHSLVMDGQKFARFNHTSGISFKGFTSAFNVMVNGFYDAYFLGEDSNVVPYVGVGLGTASINNSIKFYCQNVNAGTSIMTYTNNGACTLTPNPGGPSSNVKSQHDVGAGQVILGFSYFMDDFLTFNLDVRHFATRSNAATQSKVQYTTLNVGFNGAFDFG